MKFAEQSGQSSTSRPDVFVAQYLEQTLPLFSEYSGPGFAAAINLMVQAYLNRKPVFICGNGGSAGTSGHMVNDLIKGTVISGKQRLKVIGLADNMSTLTAYGNDCGYESVFVEQLKSLWEPQSVLIAISASGNSPNVVQSAQFTRKNGGESDFPRRLLGRSAERKFRRHLSFQIAQLWVSRRCPTDVFSSQ